MLRPLLISGVVLSLCSSPVFAGGEHGEIGVGRTAAGQLVAHMHFPQPVPIPRSIFPGFTGYATALIGFANVPVDDAGEDVLMLAPGADISARLTANDPGARLYDGPPVLQVGQSMNFGPPDFDYHPVYNIPSAAAAPGVDVFTLRFVLHDASGLYTDSDEFSISLTPACAADYNLSAVVSVQDIFDFLADYFRGFPQADFNRSGAVTVQDIFDFLAAYFVPCL